MSLLRYPGGKQRQVDLIRSHFPETFSEYREPFLGGGSILLSIGNSVPRVGGELHPDLACLWQVCKNEPQELYQACFKLAQPHSRGEELPHPIYNARLGRVYEAVYASRPTSALERAVRYLFLNRTSRGGFVNDQLKRRKCFSNPRGWSIALLSRIFDVSEKLRTAQVLHAPYQEVLRLSGEAVFCFCDPPYVKDTLLPKADKLYQFGFTLLDHVQLRNELQKLSHKILVSYDDHPLIRKLYKDWNIQAVSWKYAGNTSKTPEGAVFRPVGGELLISNY